MRTRSLSMALGLLAGLFLLVGPTASYGQTVDFPITIDGKGGSGDPATGTLGNDAGWRMIGVPVTGANAGNLTASVDDDGSVIEFDLPSGKMFYQWDDSNANWVAPSSGDPLTNGRGYILFLFDDSDGTPGGDDDPLDPDLDLGVNTGTVRSRKDPVTVSGLNTGADFHLLANPYNTDYRANRIESNNTRITNGTDFSSVIQVWNGGDSSGEGVATEGTYCGFDIDTNNSTTIDVSYGEGCTNGNSGGRLSAWQAFFLNRTDGNSQSQVTFNRNGTSNNDTRDIVGDRADSQTSTSSSAQQKSVQKSSTEDTDYVRLGFSLMVENSSGEEIARDGASTLYFHPEATPGVDSKDASKLTPLTSPYAVIGPVGATGEGEAIKAWESRPLDTELPIKIPFRFQTSGEINGTAHLRAARWDGVPSDWTVTLIDTKGTSDPDDDEEYELTPSDTTGYTFEVGDPQSQTNVATADASGSEAGGAPTPPEQLSLTEKALEGGDEVRTSAQQSAADSTRFVVRVAGNSLPVEMMRFGATLSSRQATLQWATASETNNAGFEVQRRGPEAESFEPLGFVESKAEGGTAQKTLQYQYETGELAPGRHAFRLRQVDTDGSATLSDTTEVEVALGAASEVTVAPNPVQTEATVTLRVREVQEVSAGLYDMLGRKVRTLHKGRMAPRQAHRLSLGTNGLTSGAYLLRIQGERFETTRRVTVVQ